LFLWVVGGIMTLAGYDNGKPKLAVIAHIVNRLLIYLEFGILLPYNGGEFIYVSTFVS
jgi:hypothetical protein